MPTLIGKVLRRYAGAVASHVDTNLEQTANYRLTVDANGNATLNTDNPEVKADIIRKMEHLLLNYITVQTLRFTMQSIRGKIVTHDTAVLRHNSKVSSQIKNHSIRLQKNTSYSIKTNASFICFIGKNVHCAFKYDWAGSKPYFIY